MRGDYEKSLLSNDNEKDREISEHRETINLMLIYIWVTIGVSILHMVINQIIQYIIRSQTGSSIAERVSYFNFAYIFTALIDLIAVTIVAALTKNTKVRTWFIVLATIRLVGTGFLIFRTFYK